MKIAIPHENGRLHGHFGGCREFALIELVTAYLNGQLTATPDGCEQHGEHAHEHAHEHHHPHHDHHPHPGT